MMSNEITQKVRMTIEVEMDDYQRDQLEISKNTQVLGGNIVQLDWEGGVFDEVDGYRKLFEAVDSNLMGIAFDNMEDEAFIGELQLAIKRVIVSIDRKKGKVIYWDVKGVKGGVKADMKTTTIKSFLNWAVADITCEEKK